MSKYIVAGLCVALLLPPVAHAVTAAELRAQIEALLVQMNQLQQALAQPQKPNTTPGLVSGGGVCPVLTRTLSRGSRGDDVMGLQKFLLRLGLLAPDGVTGYYGALTERGVQGFQTQNDVVNVGDPASTGYGVVGLRTREAIAARCADLKPITSRCTVHRPILCRAGEHAEAGPKDAQGCATAPRCVLGSASDMVPITSCPAYQTPLCSAGMHAHSGAADSNGCPGAPVCILDNTQPVDTPIAQGPLNAAPRVGSAPLTVTFTGNTGQSLTSEIAAWLDYGDGSIDNAVGVGSFTRTHTYQNIGTYTAKLLWRAFGPGHIPYPVNTAGTAVVAVGGVGAEQSTIRVMSPNGGEVIHAWRETPVQWEAAGIPSAYTAPDGAKVTYKILLKLVAKGGKVVGYIPTSGNALDSTLRSVQWDPATLNGGFNALDEVKLQASVVKQVDRCALAGVQASAAQSTCRTDEVVALDESDTWFGLKGVTVCNNAVYPISCITS
ncbi:MAG: peptidoglycan-binding protein [Candidatus Pacebacteria bacterium]|nr:peptidoglycan-binding protein [Candidatus Paceibacterota bacterium]